MAPSALTPGHCFVRKLDRLAHRIAPGSPSTLRVPVNDTTGVEQHPAPAIDVDIEHKSLAPPAPASRVSSYSMTIEKRYIARESPGTRDAARTPAVSALVSDAGGLEFPLRERLEHLREGPAFIKPSPHPRGLLGRVHRPACRSAAAAPHVDDGGRRQQALLDPASDRGLVSTSRRRDLGRRRPFRALGHRRSLPTRARPDPLADLAVLMQTVCRMIASSSRGSPGWPASRSRLPSEQGNDHGPRPASTPKEGPAPHE